MSEAPIEDYLDELLRCTRADVRSTRRLLDEAGDHLYAAAEELQRSGMSRPRAESEAVRRFGPVRPVVDATYRRSLLALVVETLRAAVMLAGWGLVAVGVSGLVVLVMNALAGRSFVGGVTVFGARGASIAEIADDAVVLRVLAGLVGLLMLAGYGLWRRGGRARSVLPDGLVDALGAAAFAAGTVGLAAAAVDQAARTGTTGVGFPLSGAVVALPAALYFCLRAARALLPSRTGSPDPG